MAKAKAKLTADNKKKVAAKKDKEAQAALRERERKKQKMRRKRYVTMFSCVSLIIGGLIAYNSRVDLIIANYLRQAWIDSTQSAGLTFEELVVKGRNLTPVEDVVECVGMAIGDSLFARSISQIHQNLLNLEMVKAAHVSRDLSGKIIVQLTERKPFALWQYHDKLRVIDEEGIALLRANPDDYPQLITVVGENAPSHMRELISFLMSEKELSEEVVAASYVSNRRWDVHFVSGVQIMLPEYNPKSAWEKLAKMQREHDILKQKLQAIDLRIEDKIYITLPDDEKIKDKNNEVQGASEI